MQHSGGVRVRKTQAVHQEKDETIRFGQPRQRGGVVSRGHRVARRQLDDAAQQRQADGRIVPSGLVLIDRLKRTPGDLGGCVLVVQQGARQGEGFVLEKQDLAVEFK